MRKLLLSLVVGLFCVSAIAQQSQVIPLSAGENQLKMRGVNPESFSAKLSFKEINLENTSTPDGDFSVLALEDAVKPNNFGQANLPVISKMIEVPYGAEIQIVINSYDEEVINLSDYGINRIEPTQPSYTKSTPEEEMYFVMDEGYYSTDEYETTPLVISEIHGIMRGLRVGRIEIRPYHYNPVENTIIFYNNLDFDVHFVGADLATTEEMKNKYYTNEFDGVYTNTINYIAPAAKDAFYDTSNPVKYVLVANTAFQATLQPFVEWKTRQGYNVIEYYVASGTTNTSIKAYIEDLYDAATASDPAPLYVLIVGDHSGNYAIPGFDTQLGGYDHVSDVYFATYDGGSDYIPDLYMGRLSANTTTELQNALDKILPYEQYTMPSTSHLDNAVLIAGVDATWGPKAGDGAIWYFAEYYINAAHGFNNIYAYYQNQPSGPSFAGDSDADIADDNIIANITSGVGFVNYTAHCYELGWADPSVENSDIANFNNLNEYPFMIGNCCLSYKFNYDDSFGENLLQTANEGAVGYIGTSNNSLWDEDFWWGVGLTSMAISTANVGDFSPSNSDDGVYDALMHENGQDFSEWYNSASQMIYSGNAAVQSSSSGNKQYYWEIYHCSGDPSLMPYMSEPDPLTLSFANPMQGATTLVVTTEPYTYVGLSKDNVLIDAKWSGAGTTVTLNTAPFTGETYCVVGTKQDRSPYIVDDIVPVAANPPVAEFSGTPTTILEGESVTFTDASDYPASWSWTFGDAGTSTDQNPVHTYSTAGTYTVSLTVTNGLGSDTETKTSYITVNANTNPPVADFLADITTVNVGGTVNFTDLTTNNPTGWSWIFDGGTSGTSTDQNPSVVYNTPGTYQVSLTATSPFGTDNETKAAYIIVIMPDVLMSDGTTTACAGLFKDSGGDGGEYASDENFTHTFYPGTPGAFAQLTFTEFNVEHNTNGGCWDELSIYDGVGTGSLIGTYCGDDYTVIGTGGVITSTDATDGALTVVFTSDGSVTEAGWSADISCYSPSTPPVAEFSASATTIGVGGTVSFTDLSTNTPTSWAWTFTGAATTSSTDQNPTGIVYNAIGTYEVSLTATNAFGSDTETKVAYINVIDIPVITAFDLDFEPCTDFQVDAFAPWTTYDGDGQAAYGSTTYDYTNEGYTGSFIAFNSNSSDCTPSAAGTDYDAHGGDRCGICFNATNSTVTDDWLISSQVTLQTNSSFEFWAKTLTDQWGLERFNVYVSTTDNSIGSFTNISGGTYIEAPNTWTEYTYDLSAYDGQDIYVAVQCVSDDAFGFMIDDILINTEAVSTPPVADFSANGSTTGCETLSVSFTDLTTGVPTSWAWDFGDGGSSAVQNPSYTYNTPGTYTVELTVTNAFGSDVSTQTNIIVIDATPTVDAPANLTECDSYTLPALTNGNYFASTGGVTPISVGTAITADQTIYVYAVNGTCTNENTFDVTILVTPTVDAPSNVTECDSYTLPALTNGDYYASTGGVTPISVGTAITATETIYVYAANGICTDENSFTVTIDNMPLVDAPSNVTECETYTLPALTNGAYFATTGGVSPISVGTAITATQTIYVYASNGTCEDENSFTVTIDNMPLVDAPANLAECESYTLPALTNGAYFANADGVGPISVGTAITSDQTIYVYASNGTCEAENSFDVTIYSGFTAMATGSDETGAGANDGSVTVVMTGGLAPYTGTWTPSGTTNSAGSSMTLSSLTGGYYSVIVEDANGCTTTAGATVNTAGSAPVANFSADATNGCDNLVVAFTDLSNNTPTSWAWTFGDGGTSTDQNPTYTYSTPGTYTVMLTATNASGSDDVTMTDYILVGETPVLTMSMTQETVLGNDGTASVSVVGGATPYDYVWDGGYSTNMATALVAGTYCVTVTEANGCSATDCVVVTQETVLNPPVADFNADVTTGCETLVVTFTDLSTNTPTSWAWTFGDGGTSTDQNPVYTYAAPGTYTVVLTATNADGSDDVTMTDYIVIGENPSVDVSTTPASGELVADGTASASVTGGTAPYVITWSNSVEGATVTGLVPETYSVIVVDALGCMDTEAFVIDFTDGIAINEVVYSIYPNPVSHVLTVEFDGQISDNINIVDVLGQVVMTVNPSSEITNIDVSKLQPGVYFVNILVGEKEYTNKLVVN